MVVPGLLVSVGDGHRSALRKLHQPTARAAAAARVVVAAVVVAREREVIEAQQHVGGIAQGIERQQELCGGERRARQAPHAGHPQQPQQGRHEGPVGGPVGVQKGPAALAWVGEHAGCRRARAFVDPQGALEKDEALPVAVRLAQDDRELQVFY